MSLGLEKRNVIKQGKSFVQFLVMSFARDKWDKIAELTSCTRSTATKKKKKNPRELDMDARGRICANLPHFLQTALPPYRTDCSMTAYARQSV